MEIGPIKRNQFVGEELKSETTQRQPAAEPEPESDSLELSAEARREIESRLEEQNTKQLVAEADVALPVKPDDRYTLIRGRISSGYYDRVAVKNVVIDRMIDEMLRNINEFYR